jgi:molybdopterin synthase catalytic subunit
VNAPVIVTGLSADPLDTAVLAARIRRIDCGAVVVFEGMTRSPNDGEIVERLSYEAWTERAEAQLHAIASEIAAEHGLGGAVAVHRTGDVPPGVTSVVVAASAAHRDAAFAGARALIERIKAEAAIWKQEIGAGRARWAGLDEPALPNRDALSRPPAHGGS